MASRIYDYTPEQLQELLDTSSGYSDILRKMGLNPKGGNPNTLKKVICEYGLDESVLNRNRHKLYQICALKTHNAISYRLEDIFNGLHPNYQSSKLLVRLVQAGYKQYRCEKCGISVWNGLEISLHLHHKDGDHTNQSLENLQILCPNCHSQTNNYAGKRSYAREDNSHNDSLDNSICRVHIQSNKCHSNRPTREALKHDIRTMPFTHVGNKYHVTDNAVRKWCDIYKLPRKKSIIKLLSDDEWDKI